MFHLQKVENNPLYGNRRGEYVHFAAMLLGSDLMFVHKLVAVEWDPKAHFTEVSNPTSFLEKKAQTRRYPIISRHMSKV